MTKTNRTIILTVFLMISCNGTMEQHETKETKVNEIVPAKAKDVDSTKEERTYLYTLTYFDYKNTSLTDSYCDTAFAKFSNDTTEDCLRLNVPNGLVTKTETTVRITTEQGEIIYEHIFPTSDLINGYATEEIKTDVEMEKYILSQAKVLLKKGLFKPSEQSEESYLNRSKEEDFKDYEVFEEIKKKDKMMFHYCLNEESHYFLGYSVEKKKVVEIIECC